MTYIMPDGHIFDINNYKVIADFSNGGPTYKLQIDLIVMSSELDGRIVDTTKRIIIPADGAKDFIGKYKVANINPFESISIKDVWNLLVLYRAVSGGVVGND